MISQAPARGIHRRTPIVVTPELIDLFWSRVDKSNPDGCWPWTRALRQGYGCLGWKKKLLSCHCVAFVIAHGPIPGGHVVRHTCDFRPCCNPAHLVSGTYRQNIADMDERGRRNAAKGSRNAGAKLTETDVLIIRERKLAGETLRVLAADFGVGVSCIDKIIYGQRWRHVPEAV